MMEKEPTIRTIRLKGALGAKFGREFRIAVGSGGEAMQALGAQIPGFKEFIYESESKGLAFTFFHGKRNINPKDELFDPSGGDITVMTVPTGNKRGGLFQTILGVALIASVFMFPTLMATNLFMVAGSQVALGTLVFGLGMSLALGGLAQMLSPQPKLNIPNQAETLNNKTFNGPVNMSAQGGFVPIAIGRCLIGSMVMSGSIYTNNGQTLAQGLTSAGNPAVGWVGVGE